MSKNACGLGLAKIRSRHPDGFIALVTLKGCKPCGPMKSLVKKSAHRAIPVYEFPAEKVACDPILDELKATESPSVFYICGKTTKAISKGDRTDEQIRAQIAAIVGKGKK